ncbi:MAG: Ig-like domain-containing protein [Heliobacteriaceae bacterium]|nr:Ig-like domain-containing protein [Heliobacteriaceae bacterium]
MVGMGPQCGNLDLVVVKRVIKIKWVFFLVFFWLFPSAADAFAPWPEKKDVPTDKVWTIIFNRELQAGSLSPEAVYVVDSAGNRVPVVITPTADKKGIVLDAIPDYRPGQRYTLYITNSLKSKTDANLKEPVKMEFVTLKAPCAVTGISLNQSTLSLTVGGAAGVLTATILPADADNQEVAWYSDNPAVASVSNGVVTPVGSGVTMITASSVSNPHCMANCKVTVADPAVTAITYRWKYRGWDYTWGPINWPTADRDAILRYYRNAPHPLFSRFTARTYVNTYTMDPYDDKFIADLVGRLSDYAESIGLRGSEVVDFVLSFVQGLPYTADNVTTPYNDYPRYPLETILENGGDCEDTALLAAVLLREMGYGTAILFVPGSAPTHAALGVLGSDTLPGTYYLYNGRRYYYTETTGSGWRVGQIPWVYSGVSAIVVPLWQETATTMRVITGEGETLVENDDHHFAAAEASAILPPLSDEDRSDVVAAGQE